MPNDVIPLEALRGFFVEQFWTSDEEDFFEPEFDRDDEEKCSLATSFTREELHAILEQR